MADVKTWLDAQTFQVVVDSTPLVSIDLLVRDSSGRILVGERVNRPAQGYWFVPGGRILKNESLADAFARLTESELGVRLAIADGRFLGLYEHFYEDSIFTDGGERISTHYVVSGFEVRLPDGFSALPYEQHNQYLWLSECEFMTNESVHAHSRWYLDKEKGFI
ncbi:GDP-mannose mannosyl hydrolase [Thalassolituus sp. LLYu03]|uniref:GDP-mannose mannosyl hydrolase n=1 Tax=Thalassolituus sp. LLYu03 TaxID=3421656 RepID=UPI003D26DB5E